MIIDKMNLVDKVHSTTNSNFMVDHTQLDAFFNDFGGLNTFFFFFEGPVSLNPYVPIPVNSSFSRFIKYYKFTVFRYFHNILTV